MRRAEVKKNSFSFLYLIAGLIIGAIVVFFIKDFYDKKNVTGIQSAERLTKQADDLLSEFIHLQNMNEQYASLLANKNLDSSGLKSLDSINVLITDNQVGFRRTLDSLQSKKNNYDKYSYLLLLKITDAYIAALNQSNSINTTRNSVAIGNTNYSFDQTMLYAMQNELKNKQLQLINAVSPGTVKNMPPSDYMAMMRQQDSIVTQVIQKQKSRNQNVTDYSSKLERDNERLTQELQSLRETNTNTNIKTETTIPTSQLSEQLDLARADCYLTRADARKIISNTKQRRDLLQQALTILNTLSQSGNAATKTQAQQKLNELKTIAASNHD